MAQTSAEQTRDPSKAPTRRALLIGIRIYPQIPEQYGGPLAGCHNDVADMREMLLERDFPDGDIRVLVDVMERGCECPFCAQARQRPAAEAEAKPPSPTREGIRAAVRDLTAATGPGDVVVVYYSGHGSEFAGRGLWAGQRFQTIVPHDSGRGSHQNRDIADFEIEGWIRDFHRRTPYLTMIFDCCHAGGMTDTRGAGPDGVRQVKADERQEDPAFAAELRQVRKERAPDGDSLRGPTGWLRGAGRSAIVLSASAAKELSSETVADGKKYGLFTAKLCGTLRGRDTDGLTWANVFPEIAEAVTAENLSQHPRREGNSPIFEHGAIDPDDVYPPDVVELKKLAVVIGIDYDRSDAETDPDAPAGFPPLRTPKSDASEVARALREVQGYEIVGLSRRSPGPLLNEKATRRRIHQLINRLITVKARVQRETAVVIYFAGHGVVRTGDDGEHAGYLIPWEAEADDPDTWLPMKDLRDQLVDGIRDPARLERLGLTRPLERLTSRHLLLVLDCCFGGALSFDFFRGGGTPDRPIYYSEYKRFVEGTAWELLTSASFNQQAMDRDPSDPEQPYSPFAQAMIDGLTTAEADSFRAGSRSDQIVTAAELHQYVDARLRALSIDVQTPALMPLRPLRGQYIFHVPGFKPSPLPDPPLRPDADPWRGEKAYRETVDPNLFCGRALATLELLDRFLTPRDPGTGPAPRPALAVVGRSGSGKRSLVQAGLLPLLTDPAGGRRRLRSWLRRSGHQHLLITRDDLKAVRKWAAGLSLDVGWAGDGSLSAEQRDAKAEALAGTIRDWAKKAGLGDRLDAGGQIQAGVQMSQLGVPSFAESSAEAGDRAWLRRLGVFVLLDQPQELAARLRRWLATGGVADFLSVSDRALGGLVGRWREITGLAEAKNPKASGGKRLLLWIGALEERLDDIRQDDWRAFADAGDTLTLATVRTDSLTRDPDLGRALETRDAEGRRRWQLHAVARPSRAELLEVALNPASARAIVFEPPELAERLVEEVEATPSPLPLLSETLTEMYQRAWERRRDSDRLLTAADLIAPKGGERDGTGAVAELFSQRAEATYQRLLGEDPEVEPNLRSLFLRTVSLASERPASRPVHWRELRLTDPAERRRLETRVLPALLASRLVVAGREHLELACEGMIEAWERLRQWVESAGKSAGGLNALWRRALEWEESRFEGGKLWSHDEIVPRLFRSTTLCRLERAFIVASEMQRRLGLVRHLAGQALPDVAGEWQRSALLAAEAAASAIETREVAGRLLEEPWLVGHTAAGEVRPTAEAAARLAVEARDLSRWTAEQALRDVLARTPLSVPLVVPEDGARITGLGFDDEGRLRVRIAVAEGGGGGRRGRRRRGGRPGDRRREGAGHARAGRVDTGRVDTGRVWADRVWADRVYAWDLRQLAEPPILLAGAQAPEPGAGQAKVKRLSFGFVKELPVVSAPPAPQAPPGPWARAGHDKTIRYFAPLIHARRDPFSTAPKVLHGHRGVPTFLAFSKRQAAAGSSEEEPTKLWLVSAANLPRRTEVRLWPILERGRMQAEPRAIPDQRLEELLPKGDSGTAETSWRIDLEPGGSRFVLRHLETRQTHTVELHRRREDPEEEVPAGTGRRRPSLPAAGPLPALRLPPKPPRPPWLADSEPAPPNFLFHPDGRWLAAVSETGEAWLWSLPDPTLRWSAGGGVTCLDFNPAADGAFLLAAGTASGRPWLISPEISACQLEHGPRGRASAIAFSPDGRRLAIGNLDDTVCLWTLADPQGDAGAAQAGSKAPPVVLRGESHGDFAVSSLAFDPEGQRLGVERRTVYEHKRYRVDVYRLDLEESILLARGHAGRELEPRDLPPELRRDVFGAAGEPDAERGRQPATARERMQEKQRYLAALAVATTPDPEEKT